MQLPRSTGPAHRPADRMARQGEWSLHSTKGDGFRIDHAFGNGAFVAAGAPICTCDHRARATGLTDWRRCRIYCVWRGEIPLATLPHPASGKPLAGASFVDY